MASGAFAAPTSKCRAATAKRWPLLATDSEGGAEVYSLATTRDQARIVFGDAQTMARQSAGFRSRFGVGVGAHNLHVLASGSKFEALSAEGSTLDGLNIHFGCIDELHAHKTRTVYDVVETGTGKRDNSLLWVITTAGSNRSGICYEIRTFVTRLLDGVFADDSQFGIVYGLDDGDDWTLEESLIKANPNWGIFGAPGSAGAAAGQGDADAERGEQLQDQASQRVGQCGHRVDGHALLGSLRRPRARYRILCGTAVLDRTGSGQQDRHRRLLLVFAHAEIDGGFAVFGRYYLPEDTVHATGNSQYPGWMGSGRLTVTPGNVIDFSWIEADLVDFASRFAIQAVAFDPFQATQLSTRMLAEGLPMIEVRPTVLNFSEPMKTLEALVLQEKLIHDGDPVLGWMVSNVVAHLDAKDNIYPRKERPENKIDGIVALIMALSRAITPGTQVVLGADYELVML
jgi:phage terminase large subunit-like protein